MLLTVTVQFYNVQKV